jgi:FMN phosphatase YigB (HAD superfamily)
MAKIKGIIFDFNRTLYDPDTHRLVKNSLPLLHLLFLHGYKLCLLSVESSTDRSELIRKLGLKKYFLEIQIIKGEKTISNFQACLDKMQLKPEEVAVIGDRIKSEIAIAKKLNLKTFWFRSGKFANEMPAGLDEEPDYTVNNLYEIIYLLEDD